MNCVLFAKMVQVFILKKLKITGKLEKMLENRGNLSVRKNRNHENVCEDGSLTGRFHCKARCRRQCPYCSDLHCRFQLCSSRLVRQL